MRKGLIAVFVVWHAFAVGVFSIPREASDPVSRWTLEHVLPLVAPYVLLTSQWQIWNLFAPDPPRLVTVYHTEVMVEGIWKRINTVEPGTFSIWRHSTRFQLMRNSLTAPSEDEEVAERYLHLQCAELGVKPGTPMRLTYEHYVIPKPVASVSRSWWTAWSPDPVSLSGPTVVCPPG